jgi:outer membrane lipoprotein-sorting protein
MRIVAALCIILAVASGSFAQSVTTDQILAKLDEKAKVFQTFEASFVMVQVLTEVKTQPESGKIYMKAGKSAPMVMLEVTSPARAVKKVWVRDNKGVMYNRPQNVYQEYKIGPNSNAFELLLTGFGVSAQTIKKHYDPQAKGGEMIDGVATEVLDLTLLPNEPGPFRKVTLWLDPKTWTPVQIRLTEKGNNTTDYKYSNVRLNKGVSDSVFKIDIPKGALKQ